MYLLHAYSSLKLNITVTPKPCLLKHRGIFPIRAGNGLRLEWTACVQKLNQLRSFFLLIIQMLFNPPHMHTCSDTHTAHRLTETEPFFLEGSGYWNWTIAPDANLLKPNHGGILSIRDWTINQNGSLNIVCSCFLNRILTMTSKTTNEAHWWMVQEHAAAVQVQMPA